MIGYWDRFGRPKTSRIFGQSYTSVWWVDPGKDAQAHGCARRRFGRQRWVAPMALDGWC